MEGNPVSDRDCDDTLLTNTIFDIHRASKRSYGSPRVHAELRLGSGPALLPTRVERLMRQAGVVGTPAHGPRLHPPGPQRQGLRYLAVVPDAWSRRIADHIRSELVVDALQTVRIAAVATA